MAESNPSHPNSGHKVIIALAGNPNCGKSALFNTLTGIRQTTGNWPGVTVDRKEGRFRIDNTPVTAIDLPGIYSLDASSIDEQVARDYLLSREADIIVNVIDASNLERNLYLTVQMSLRWAKQMTRFARRLHHGSKPFSTDPAKNRISTLPTHAITMPTPWRNKFLTNKVERVAR